MPFVLDASAALPWCFRDEATAQTDALLSRATAGERIYVPAHWPAEMLSGLTRAARRGHIDDPGVNRFLTLFPAYNISVDAGAFQKHWDEALPLLRLHRLSGYDAMYLSLAKRLNIGLATLDSRLQEAATSEGVQLVVELAKAPEPQPTQNPTPTPAKADPAIYPKLRANAMELRFHDLPPGAVHAILMDWHIGSGTATVLAAADGTASIYLDSGGGFIGGSHSHPAIRAAALLAMQAANGLVRFSTEVDLVEADSPPLPTPPNVFFHFVTAEGLRHASATDTELQTGGSPFVLLGYAMQRIVTEYRATQHP